MKNVVGKIVEKNKIAHFIFRNFFRKIMFYEIMWEKWWSRT